MIKLDTIAEINKELTETREKIVSHIKGLRLLIEQEVMLKIMFAKKKLDDSNEPEDFIKDLKALFKYD